MNEHVPVQFAADLEPTEKAGIVAAGVYAAGRKVAELAEIEDADPWLKQADHVVWIGLFEPSSDLLERVQKQFGLHHLAIEDAGKAHQRPKAPSDTETPSSSWSARCQMQRGRMAFGETHLFVGRGYVVSVRHGASTSYAAVRERCEACPKPLSHGEDYILYAVLDFVVDNYQPVLETIQTEVEKIEDRVLAGKLVQCDVERLYALRRDLLRLRNAAAPLVDVCRRLEHAEVLPIDPEMQPLFRDVTDHVHRVEEDITTLREVLAFAFEASLMMVRASRLRLHGGSQPGPRSLLSRPPWLASTA